jgi:hypothetical protein
MVEASPKDLLLAALCSPAGMKWRPLIEACASSPVEVCQQVVLAVHEVQSDVRREDVGPLAEAIPELGLLSRVQEEQRRAAERLLETGDPVPSAARRLLREQILAAPARVMPGNFAPELVSLVDRVSFADVGFLVQARMPLLVVSNGVTVSYVRGILASRMNLGLIQEHSDAVCKRLPSRSALLEDDRAAGASPNQMKGSAPTDESKAAQSDYAYAAAYAMGGELLLSRAATPRKFRCTRKLENGEECGKEYDTQQHLDDHVRGKHENAVYRCSYPRCTKTYSYARQLRAHERAEHENVVYECRHAPCTAKFNHVSNRTRHERAEHENVVYECRHAPCTAKFSDSGNRNKHERAQHENVLYECRHAPCTAKFKHAHQRNSHENAKHKVQQKGQ